MAKFYVISDVHGFYDEMLEALDVAGFDKNNEEHWLVSCGDMLDRGRQPRQVMNYIMGLSRKILIRGNHEDLILDCLAREYPYGHDWHNGTAQTVVDLVPSAKTFEEACMAIYPKMRKFIDNMINYFETKNYIFVHSFVPLNCNSVLPPHYLKGKNYTKMDNWCEAHSSQWEDARWGNPFELAEQGLLPNKTLVFGHWHCSAGWAKTEGLSEFGYDAKFDPFYGDGFIAIDACVAHSGKINVVVLEDEFMEGEVN